MPEAKEAMAPVMGILDRCAGFINRCGINYQQYRLIVATKFKLAKRDNVGVGLSLNSTRSGSKHSLRNSFLLNLIVGLMMMFITLVPVAEIMTYTLYYSTTFVLTFLTMLTNYSGMMLDTRDRALYITRGVQPRTLNAARLTVVAVYLLLNILALGVPALIGVVIRFGVLAALGAFISLLIMTEFAFLLALVVYLLVLRFFDGERLKNILNFVQIALIIGIYGASQVLPHLSGSMLGFLGTGQGRIAWYVLLSIPSWFAGLPMLLRGHFDFTVLALTALSILVPLLLTWAYSRNAADFEQSLAKLDQASSRRRKNSRYFTILRRLLIRNPEEATYFDFSWHILQEEREYKLRVYPLLGYALIFPIAIGASYLSAGAGIWRAVVNFGPYVPISLLLGLPVAVSSLAFSSQPAAMSLFLRVPILHDGYMLRGTLKAMFARVFLPLILVWTVLMTAISGLQAFLACLAIGVLLYAAALWLGRIIGSSALPFARQSDPGKQNGGTAVIAACITLPFILIVLVAGGLLHAWWFAAALLAAGGIMFFAVNGGFKNAIFFDLSKIDADEH